MNKHEPEDLLVFGGTGQVATELKWLNIVSTLGSDELVVVDDQQVTPTPARAIAAACLAIADQLCADPSITGTYHFGDVPSRA